MPRHNDSWIVYSQQAGAWMIVPDRTYIAYAASEIKEQSRPDVVVDLVPDIRWSTA